jgi:hypothetical protein
MPQNPAPGIQAYIRGIFSQKLTTEAAIPAEKTAIFRITQTISYQTPNAITPRSRSPQSNSRAEASLRDLGGLGVCRSIGRLAVLFVAAVVTWPFRQAQGSELVEGLASGVTAAATAKPKPVIGASGPPATNQLPAQNGEPVDRSKRLKKLSRNLLSHLAAANWLATTVAPLKHEMSGNCVTWAEGVGSS